MFVPIKRQTFLWQLLWPRGRFMDGQNKKILLRKNIAIFYFWKSVNLNRKNPRSFEFYDQKSELLIWSEVRTFVLWIWGSSVDPQIFNSAHIGYRDQQNSHKSSDLCRVSCLCFATKSWILNLGNKFAWKLVFKRLKCLKTLKIS